MFRSGNASPMFRKLPSSHPKHPTVENALGSSSAAIRAFMRHPVGDYIRESSPARI